MEKQPKIQSALEIIGRQPRKGPHVFDVPNRDRCGVFRRTVDTIRKKTGIEFTFHLLRHYFSTQLIAKGIDIITVSELLGHSRTMTSLLYSHTSPERKRRAVEGIVINLDTEQGDVN